MGLSLQHVPESAWPDIWIGVRNRLRVEFGQGIFDTWIAPLALVSVADGHVRLSAPRRLIRDYVASHHAARLERIFAGLSREFVSLDIVVAAQDPREVSAPKMELGATAQRQRPLPTGPKGCSQRAWRIAAGALGPSARSEPKLCELRCGPLQRIRLQGSAALR